MKLNVVVPPSIVAVAVVVVIPILSDWPSLDLPLVISSSVNLYLKMMDTHHQNVSLESIE